MKIMDELGADLQFIIGFTAGGIWVMCIAVTAAAIKYLRSK